MIDLGVELAGYGYPSEYTPLPPFTVASLHDMRARLWTGGVNLGSLAGLQAQGFNTEPPEESISARRYFYYGTAQ